jgi:hypothetical protein
VAATIALLLAAAALATGTAVKLRKVSSDPYANRTSYHATEVEPDSFSSGKTIVAAFQVGRFADGGANDIGWARSPNGGRTWKHGLLPGTTAFSRPKGRFARESDPSVAYDEKHKTWLIGGLALSATPDGVAIIVSRSTDGGTTWDSPVTVKAASSGESFDKDWIVCDDWAGSPHYGSCYAEWDDAGNGGQLHMGYSRDGGLTWGQSAVPAADVIGGQPVIQPDGTVVMPIDDGLMSAVESFVSTDGGVHYAGPAQIATVSDHLENGGLRSPALPSATVDGAGRVYVAWADCRFRSSCAANDIVFSSSSDGTHWSALGRIPIDKTTSRDDHFLPGLAAAADGSGKLGLTYYYFPRTNCIPDTCRLDVGFVSSTDNGASWSAPVKLAGPMKMKELPLTTEGYMVGDYSTTSLLTGISGDPALSVFAVGLPVKGKTCNLASISSCDEPIKAPTATLAIAGPGPNRTTPTPVLSTRSDHPPGRHLTYR